MLWVVFSSLTALCESLKDVFSKKGLADIDEYVIAWSLRFFALPFLLPILFFVKLPALTKDFWLALFLGGGLNAICTILYMKAIKRAALSLTVPLVAFTPLFLLLTSPFMVGEFPDLSGIGGILYARSELDAGGARDCHQTHEHNDERRLGAFYF
jgi:uncharacterized membrane protein